MTSRWNLDQTSGQRHHFKRGKKISAEGFPLNDNQVIQDLDQAETYKYLGMEEGEGVQQHKMKIKVTKEYKRRIKLVLKSEPFQHFIGDTS